ncbi:MAG: hypothetical protein Q9181_004909 [Wetmoreana brouardii]
MGFNEIRTALKVELKKPAAEQPGLHVNPLPKLTLSSGCLPIIEQMASRRQVIPNWVNDTFVLRHVPVPFIGTIKNGEVVKIECVDWTGGQIGNNDSADDVKNVDLTKVHYLSGPFEVETAEPGDVLIVEIQDVQPFQDQPWGFTGVFDKSNGGGFLDDIYPHAAKAIWDFEGIFCSSRHIPHVRFAGLIHPGILGCAPSQAILEEWNRRESELINTTQLKRMVAQPPEPQNVHAGSATDEVKAKVGKEGARTIPGRPEHGGNCDIKNLSRGSKTFLPIHVKGAKFSVGDLHFSQGDGEISFCGAIEMAGIITVKLTVMKNGIADLGMKSPMFLPGPVEPHFGPGRYLTFEGFSVDENGKQHYLDATVAYRQTTLRYKLDKKIIEQDLTSDRPLYILSAYGPGRDPPEQLFGGQPREQSFEELRYRHYELASAGNEAQAIQEAQALYSNAEQQIQKTLSDLDGAIKYIIDAAGKHPNRLDICKAKGSDPSLPQQPVDGFRSRSGAFGSASAFGKPAFGQASAPTAAFGQPAFGQAAAAAPAFGQSSAPAPAFGQSAFGQPSAPASTFGQPAFGQAAAPAPAFGQPTSLGQKPSAFGQSSNPSAATTFGQTSTPAPFGQAQTATNSLGSQQPQQQPTFGQQSGPFSQQSPTRHQVSGTFEQEQVAAPSNPFATAANPSSAFGRAAAAAANPPSQPAASQPLTAFDQTSGLQNSNLFGQTSISQPPTAFGQPSNPQLPANPFGSKDLTQNLGTFGQPKQSPVLISGRPATQGPAQTLGTPAKGTSITPTSASNVSSFIPASGRKPVHKTFGPGNPGNRKLLTWQGQTVTYIDDEGKRDGEGKLKGELQPCVKNAGGDGWERIWFPEGSPTFTKKTEEYPEGYTPDDAARENFRHFLEHGAGTNGLIPDMPPPRDMINWDF